MCPCRRGKRNLHSESSRRQEKSPETKEHQVCASCPSLIVQAHEQDNNQYGRSVIFQAALPESGPYPLAFLQTMWEVL